MLLVIFGAGASYDSFKDPETHLNVSGLQYRPPLTKDLFQFRGIYGELLEKFPAASAIAAECPERIRAGENLEVILDEFEQQSASSLSKKGQLLAFRHYLGNLILQIGMNWLKATCSSTNYSVLVNRIEQWRCDKAPSEPVYYVSFNYDFLLEDALSKTLRKWHPGNFSYYVRDPRFRLFKPHGSVLWRSKSTLPLNLDSQIERAAEVDFEDPEHGEFTDGEIYAPAIAVPMRNKVKFVCPSDHTEKFKTCIPKFTKVLIIGWAGYEDHFNVLLKEQLKLDNLPIFIANENETACNETWHHLISIWGVASTMKQINVPRFSRMVHSKELKDFLYS
jgi:hypothetical protein